jgi:hypothetical protein
MSAHDFLILCACNMKQSTHGVLAHFLIFTRVFICFVSVNTKRNALVPLWCAQPSISKLKIWWLKSGIRKQLPGSGKLGALFSCLFGDPFAVGQRLLCFLRFHDIFSVLFFVQSFGTFFPRQLVLCHSARCCKEQRSRQSSCPHHSSVLLHLRFLRAQTFTLADYKFLRANVAFAAQPIKC